MKINSKYFANKCLVGCTIFALALSTAGCETLTTDSAASKKKKKDASWFSFKKKEYQTPQSVTATWTHDVLTLPGKSSTRGFGGRFYFYNEKSQAIPVDGDLVVYGFDDTNKSQSNEDLSQATKRFRFTAEQFTTHFSEGELGASYSVWIPWDEAHGAPKKIMLIPTFLTKEGRTIRGAAASLNLPGSGKESQVQQAAAFAPSTWPDTANTSRNSHVPSDSGMRTTTIQVPSNSFLRQSQPTEALSSLTDFQSQQLAAASSLVANAFGQNGPTQASYSPQLGVDPYQQVTPANVSLGQPTSVPPLQNAAPTTNTKGWVSPEFAQLNWTGPSPRSSPSQFPAPTSKVVQPSSYPTR